MLATRVLAKSGSRRIFLSKVLSRHQLGRARVDREENFLGIGALNAFCFTQQSEKTIAFKKLARGASDDTTPDGCLAPGHPASQNVLARQRPPFFAPTLCGRAAFSRFRFWVYGVNAGSE